jgi:hypothetical protein
MKLAWRLMGPSLFDDQGIILLFPEQEIWLDISREEVNPANGRWAVEMNRQMPNSDIYEMRGIFFALTENQLLIYKSPLLR